MQTPFKLGSAKRALGFTLIESIVVIVLIGIVGGMVSVFMKNPIDAYVDTARRGELVAIADSASRFMAREIRTAVPNSVRVTRVGNISYLEFVPILPYVNWGGASGWSGGAGRYLANFMTSTDGNGYAGGDPLIFGALQTPGGSNSFTKLSDEGWNLSYQPNERRGAFVVGNLGEPGISNVYDNINSASSSRRDLPTLCGQSCSNWPQLIGTVNPFPMLSPGSHFQMAAEPVTYVCTPGAGNAGTLMRMTAYGFIANQPTDFTAILHTESMVATKVSGCFFDSAIARQNIGLITIKLDISEDGETVQLQTQVNVDNAI